MSNGSTTLIIDHTDDIESDSAEDEFDSVEELDAAADEIDPDPPEPKSSLRHKVAWKVLVAYGLIPAITLMLALTAGYLRYLDASNHEATQARIDSVQVATDGTIALLSYDADTVDGQLNAARDRLTGQFRDAYTTLTTEVVIPGSQEKQISSVVSVPAASSVSATANHAVVLVFVNQTITIGADPPSSSTSCVRVVLDRIDGRWLISAFDPV